MTEHTNTNPIYPSVPLEETLDKFQAAEPETDWLGNAQPHCGLDGECEACQ